jgi:hypothetical protein
MVMRDSLTYRAECCAAAIFVNILFTKSFNGFVPKGFRNVTGKGSSLEERVTAPTSVSTTRVNGLSPRVRRQGKSASRHLASETLAAGRKPQDLLGRAGVPTVRWSRFANYELWKTRYRDLPNFSASRSWKFLFAAHAPRDCRHLLRLLTERQ